jgi:hypothetical protein
MAQPILPMKSSAEIILTNKSKFHALPDGSVLKKLNSGKEEETYYGDRLREF